MHPNNVTHFKSFAAFVTCVVVFTSCNQSAQVQSPGVEQASAPLSATDSMFTIPVGDTTFTGSWKGTGIDVMNKGYTNARAGGYTYNMSCNFSVDSTKRLLFTGEFSTTPKDPKATPIKPRGITGYCVQTGDWIRILYSLQPAEKDSLLGIGNMILQYVPANRTLTGFYEARSPRSGALVYGNISLVKQ